MPDQAPLSAISLDVDVRVPQNSRPDDQDLRFQALPDESASCHSSLGGEFGEWIEVVKDAIGCSEERPLQATGYGTGGAGASEARVLDNIESTSPIMPAVE